MMTDTRKVRDHRFGGVGVAMVTPVDSSGALATPALTALVERVLAGGADYLVCGGTSGEGPFVPRAVRRQMIDRTLESVAGRVPIVAGLIADSLENAVAEVRELSGTGLSGLMITPPYYYPLTDDELFRFYSEVSEASAVPLILYNIPQNARNALGPELVARLTVLPHIAAIKDSGARDFATHLDIIEASADREGFTVLTGADRLLLPSLLMGGHGTISPSGNVLPAAAASIVSAYEDGDLERALQAQRALAAALKAVQVGRFPGWWKGAVSETAGGADVAVPLAPQPTAAERAEIAARLAAAQRERPFPGGRR